MAFVNLPGAVLYLDGNGDLLCAARCADRENGALIGQRPVDVRAYLDDMCNGCGTPVSTLVARSSRVIRKAAGEAQRQARIGRLPRGVAAKTYVVVQPTRAMENYVLTLVQLKRELIERMLGQGTPDQWAARFVEDLDGPVMTFAEIKAAAGGSLAAPVHNPL